MEFSIAVEKIIGLEGGLVDNPSDPGGITKYGISLRSYPSLGRDGIINLTVEQAKAIYKRDFWDKIKCDDFPPWIRLAVFDASVNQGIMGATKALQKTLGVTADGIIGPQTMRALAMLKPSDGVANYLAERAKIYMSLPTFQTFGTGWLRRLFHIAQP